MTILIKRVYLPAAATDGWRVLVDRLWPRGLRKENAALDAWLKDIAPSGALRQWFNHEAGKWPEFITRYRAELDVLYAQQPDLFQDLRRHLATGKVSLLYGAHDETHNQALVLRDWLQDLLPDSLPNSLPGSPETF
ncbi:DUF488 domain-containing protein [Azonexus sp.]|uniref:DUF488 domain-containing protein n=1 Tax=Azonexus sp. TaxID=1872668 RepID=UPI0039E393CA